LRFMQWLVYDAPASANQSVMRQGTVYTLTDRHTKLSASQHRAVPSASAVHTSTSCFMIPLQLLPMSGKVFQSIFCISHFFHACYIPNNVILTDLIIVMTLGEYKLDTRHDSEILFSKIYLKFIIPSRSRSSKWPLFTRFPHTNIYVSAMRATYPAHK